MNNDKLEPNSASNKAEGQSGCGPGCNCGGTKIGTKGRVIICLVILIAASAVLANSVIHKTGTGAGQGQNAFVTPVLLAEKAYPPTVAGKVNETNQTNSSLWEKPLQSLDSLNDVASQKDAVFLYLPVKGQAPDERAKKEIERAAGKAQSQGIKMALFTLDEGSRDYAQVTSQVPLPCVLALAKGVGRSVAATNISEANLLQALVSASRPSGCSPGGCAQPC